MPSPEWTPRVQRVDGDERGLLAYAFSLVREQRYDEAKQEIEKALQQNGNSVQANLALGMLYQMQRQFEEALPYLRSAMSADPMNARAPLLSGYSYAMMKDLPKAAQSFESALRLDPKMANAHMGLAQVEHREGEDAKAITHLREALRIDPKLTRARMQLARLLRQAGRREEAIAELHHIVRSAPGHPAASVMLAGLFMEGDQKAKAAEVLEAATRYNANSARAWALLGQVRLQMGGYREAESAFREVARLRPNAISNSLRIAMALIPQGKTPEAAELLQKLPRRGRLGSAVHKAYGDLHVAEGQHREAVESYRAALLSGSKGEETVAEIDAALAAEEEPDWPALAERCQAIIKERLEEGKGRLEEHDWEATFERFQEQMSSRMGAGWFRNAMASRQQAEH